MNENSWLKMVESERVHKVKYVWCLNIGKKIKFGVSSICNLTDMGYTILKKFVLIVAVLTKIKRYLVAFMVKRVIIPRFFCPPASK
ncbi:hypothetical protein AAY77_14085 [Providencia rettgeri]|nr:hypothetical protein AAY77_14085 [Providencia rettgeri]